MGFSIFFIKNARISSFVVANKSKINFKGEISYDKTDTYTIFIVIFLKILFTFARIKIY